ncbi:hypothetical protein Vadar_029083 [Vaccinium darrowii]|uniref:Uncharacterized protein n=1 Tax=Vaccinium darrowii TaxID=229202 RepID=A0ACB7ZG64_9ERIC|nr:hypothetical protein Vadar_029083 [Vaccinium darrowii]
MKFRRWIVHVVLLGPLMGVSAAGGHGRATPTARGSGRATPTARGRGRATPMARGRGPTNSTGRGRGDSDVSGNVHRATGTGKTSRCIKVHDFGSETQKVSLATYKLKGDAEHWWRMTKQKYKEKEHELVWSAFKKDFKDKYIPPAVKDQKRNEFLSLKQGNMTVAEYQRKFDELSRINNNNNHRAATSEPQAFQQYARFHWGSAISYMLY